MPALSFELFYEKVNDDFNMNLAWGTPPGAIEKSIKHWMPGKTRYEEEHNIESGGEFEDLETLLSLSGEQLEESPAKSIEFSEKALDASRKKKDSRSEVTALTNLGLAYFNLRDYRKAMDYFNRAQDLADATGNKKAIASLINNKGRIYIELGSYQEALEYQLKSLKILEELGDKKGIAHVYNNLGLIYWNCSNYEKALESHNKSLELKESLVDKRGIAHSLNNLGNLYRSMGRVENAKECYLKSLKIKEELGDRRGIAACLNNLGSILKDMGKYELAINYCNKSLEIKTELGDKLGIANTYLNLGIVHRMLGNPEKSLEFFDRCLKIGRDENIKPTIKSVYYNYAELYASIGDFHSAYDYFRKYTGIKEELFNEEIANRFSELQLRREVEQKDKENELLRRKNEIQMLELQSQQHLRELNETKDKFFSIIAHDLRSPFAVMSSFLNILRKIDTLDKDKLHSLILDMDRTVRASLDLLENLLQWSRSQTGRIEFNPRIFSLKLLADEVVNFFMGNAKEKNITLVSDVDPGHGVFADKNMINTVVRNLVSNAIKFSNKGGEIKIISKSSRDEVEVTVIDKGKGISRENMERLFAMETKHVSAGTAGEKGTGIGLMLCKEFVERNGGKIWAESEPNKGSTFHFTLPKQK